jgi:hypothetical protein
MPTDDDYEVMAREFGLETPAARSAVQTSGESLGSGGGSLSSVRANMFTHEPEVVPVFVVVLNGVKMCVEV